jgi:hypothetical protein
MMARGFLLLVAASLLLSLASADSGEPSTPNYRQSPVPAFGADQTVPANVAWRMVYGSFQVGASALALGRIDIDFCGEGNPVATFQIPAGGGTEIWGYAAMFRGGDCYEFVSVANPAGANSVHRYSTFDILNASFEGRDHANATWESQVHANATWEGQEHANDTWEGQVHANDTWCPLTGEGCFVPMGDCTPDVECNFYGGNFTGDFTGDFNATNATGNLTGNFTNTTVMGNITGNFTGGEYNGTFAGNFTQNFSVMEAGESLEISVAWPLINMIFWCIVGYFAIERGVWLLVFAPAAELLNIALAGAGATRMWGEQFSLLLLVVFGTLHVLFFVIPRIIANKKG